MQAQLDDGVQHIGTSFMKTIVQVVYLTPTMAPDVHVLTAEMLCEQGFRDGAVKLGLSN